MRPRDKSGGAPYALGNSWPPRPHSVFHFLAHLRSQRPQSSRTKGRKRIEKLSCCASIIQIEHMRKLFARLATQQEEADNRQDNSGDTRQRCRFAKENDPGDSHDGSAAGENGRNRRQWSAFLKEQKKRNRACADANAGEQRVVEPGHAEFLIPPPAQPEKCEIKQDRHCCARFDNETAETITNVFGGETGKNLMSAVENCGNHCVPEPRGHWRKLIHESRTSNAALAQVRWCSSLFKRTFFGRFDLLSYLYLSVSSIT